MKKNMNQFIQDEKKKKKKKMIIRFSTANKDEAVKE